MALPSPRKAIFVAFFLLNRDKSRFLEELDPGAGGTSIGEAGAGGGEDGSNFGALPSILLPVPEKAT